MNNYQNNKISIQNNEYHSSNNIANVSRIDFVQALSQSSYPVYIQEFLRDFISQNYYKHKEAKIYFTINDKEKLFIIKYRLKIFCMGKPFIINILVYLPKLYPNYEPEFYILKESNIGIIECYKDIINSRDLRISIDKICKFDAERNNIEEIIEQLKIKFNDKFPIYKDSNEVFGFEIIEKSNFKKENVKEVNVTSGLIDDDELLEIIKNETKKHLRCSYSQFAQKIEELTNNYQTLMKMNEEMKNKLADNGANQSLEKLRQENEKLKVIKDRLNYIENSLIEENDNLKKKIDGGYINRCNEIIEIKDEENFKLCVMEKAIEDYLILLRKGFQRRIISFKDMLQKTRVLSKELFYINYMKKNKTYNNIIDIKE